MSTKRWFVMFNLQGRVFPMTMDEEVVLFKSEDEAERVAGEHSLVKAGVNYAVYEAPGE